MFLKSFFLFISLITTSYFLAQFTDSSKLLNEFIKSTSRVNELESFSKITTKKANETLINNESVSDYLSNETSLFIKSYGPGYLSTISMRGANAQQTAITWNGFVINNPLNGLVDLSTIPNSFIDEIRIQYGLPSSIWGNGGVSGAIHLNNENQLKEDLKLEIGSSYGSFNNIKNYLNVKKRFKKWQTGFRIYQNKCDNNFLILNSLSEYQQNAEIKQLSFMNENYLKISSNTQLKLIFLHQRFERQIPPTLNENFSNAIQNDFITRAFLELHIAKEKSIFQYRSAIFIDNNLYNNEQASIYANNPATSFLNEIEWKNYISSQHVISASIMNTYSSSNGNNFQSPIHQNRWAGVLLYTGHSKNNKWNQTFNSRQVVNDGQLIPLTFSYGFNWKPKKSINIYGNIGKVYRLPNLNDLYWNPGGNPELLPENGFSNDIGTSIIFDTKENFTIKFEPTLFSRTINNWIIWQPDGLLWTPQNIMKVWSRGMETSTILNWNLDLFKIKLSLNTSYVISTNEEEQYEGDASYKKQLIYVPHYSASGLIEISYKKLNFLLHHNYTGYRFTSTDNTSYLKPFLLGKVKLTYNTTINKQKISFFYKLNNMYNTNYQVVLNRPMPLINHEIGINLKILKK